VAIGRALAHRPSVVLADEPTASLDPLTGRKVMALLVGLAEALGVTVVVASHDWHQVRELGLRRLSHRSHARDGGAVTESVFTG
jgi:putative ABC transport system ATP-binding protein